MIIIIFQDKKDLLTFRRGLEHRLIVFRRMGKAIFIRDENKLQIVKDLADKKNKSGSIGKVEIETTKTKTWPFPGQ